MMRLPEKIRRVLEKIVKELMMKEDVYGLGLFGSWSRGDATPASDIDLLVISKSAFPQEYVERTVANGLMIDFNFIPKKWVHGPIPQELDQKIYEVQIFYDRDWSLTNTRLLMAKSYGSPERVEMRTKVHIIDSDIYLSRATSAHSKGDHLSAQLFAATAMENILKIPLEIVYEPFSNSRFIEKVEAATEKLGMRELFNDYLEMANLSKADKASAEEKLKLFKTLWDEMNISVKQKTQTLEKMHFKIKTSLKYYLNPAFLQGAILRTTSIIDAKKYVEASHYLNSIFLNMAENYAWLKAAIEKKKVDSTSLMRSIENLEKANPKNYQNMVKFLNLEGSDEAKAAKTIKKARGDILKLRRERKHLIKTHISKS